MKQLMIALLVLLVFYLGFLAVWIEPEEMVIGAPTPTAAPEPTPEPTAAPTPEPSPEPKPVSALPGYYIKVNNAANCVTVYRTDESGAFTVPVKAMICSTGRDTPTGGVYSVGWTLRWQELFGGAYAQYCTEICKDILFHSLPYAELERPDTMVYTTYDQLGESVSAGCVRLQVSDAKWIYDNRDLIVGVEFYYDEDPGPLGRPEAPKISGNERCRSWDPTDPNMLNPWLYEDGRVPEAYLLADANRPVDNEE